MRRLSRFGSLCILTAALALAIGRGSAQAQIENLTQVIDVDILGGINDACENASGAVSYACPSGLKIGGPDGASGLRFMQVNIPKAAAITKAYIEFTSSTSCNNAQCLGTANVSIRAEDSNDAHAFYQTPFNVTGRDFVAASVPWAISNYWSTGSRHKTADISPLVQAVVDRPGWNPGNDLVFVLTGAENAFRYAYTAEAVGSGGPPKLHVEFVSHVVEVKVSAQSDDLFQYKSSAAAATSAVNDGSLVYLGDASGYVNNLAAFRFSSVPVPPGANIVKAWLRFRSNGPGTGAVDKYIRIQGEKVSNPGTFSTSTSSPDCPYNRRANSPLTDFVEWNSIETWEAGHYYDSADIRTVVQQLVSPSNGWAAGNAMVFFLYGNDHRRVYSMHAGNTPVLHIEFESNPVGGGGMPVMMIPSEYTQIGRVCTAGQPAMNIGFDLLNTGNAALAYTTAVSYKTGSGWMALSPWAGSSASLAAGGSQRFTVAFNTAGLAPGTYEATVRIDAANTPAPTPSFQEVKVSLLVQPEEISFPCDDIPLYARESASPAVLILLDLSDSMKERIDTLPEGYEFPRTEDLSTIVQEIVDLDGWEPGHAMAFYFYNESGEGLRRARAYDGSSGSAPLLHIEYESGEMRTDVRVKQSSDDAYMTDSGLFFTATQNLEICNPEKNGAALRFQKIDIPRGSKITAAWIQFTPAESGSGEFKVRIVGEASPDADSFSASVYSPLYDDEKRPKTAAEAWWTVGDWTAIVSEAKIDMAKQVIGEMFQDRQVSWGFGTWSSTAPWSTLPEPDASRTYTVIDVGCREYSDGHYGDLLGALGGTSYQSGSKTPFAPSLLGGLNYFKGLKADLSGAAFSPSICQPRVVIEVTDGRGNIPADVPGEEYVKLVEQRVSDLGAAGVSTVGVGFGLGPEGDVRAQVQRLAKVANEAGNDNPSDMVYPLHAEDDQGVGLPYYADDKNGLLDAFRTIMSGVKRAVFYGSAPAVHSATDLGDVVLVSSFNPLGWTGDLEAFGKVNGAWSVARWKASERVPASRKVFTVNHFDQVTPYTDATLTGDNYLCKDLGDIVNSVPVVVGPPPFYYTFDGYSAFKRSRGLAAPRDTLVYVGSNDGLLHAFDLSDGSEKWAFLPRSLHTKLELAGNGGSYDPCSPKYCHQSMLDGSPQVADVYANFGAAGKQWRTILVTGERGGGTAYTALDVTSGEAFDHASDPAKFLWEFTDPGLGESWADPQIERVADPPNGASAAVWGVFLSSGYAQNESQQAKKEAKVYGLEADTGLPLWSDGANPVSQVTLLKTELVIGYSTPWAGGGGPNMLFFEPGEILIGQSSGTAARVLKNEPTAVNKANVHLVDVEGPFYPNEMMIGNLGSLGFISSIQTLGDPPQLNNALNSAMVANFSPSDHIADAMYAGDLYGTMFRVDDIGKGQTPKVSKLFRFSPYPATPDVHPIRGKATYARGAAADTIWVYWGTGRYETEADKISKTTQYFLGVKDSKVTRISPLTPENLRMRQARFSEFTVGGKTQKVRTIEGDELSGYSWALELFSGQSDWGGPAAFGGSERVFTRPLAAGGVVLFTSFIPDASSCTGSGDTWLYALDYASGREPGFPVFDLNGDGKFNDADKVTVNGQKRVPVGIYVGRGQGSQPVLFKDTVFVTTAVAQKQSLGEAGGALHAIDVNLPDLKIRVESWKHD